MLQSWVDEFVAQGNADAGSVRVMPQDGDEGADTGLVGFRLPNSPAEIYIQPPDGDAAEWTVMFEPREEPVRLPSSQVSLIADGVATLASLCAFLQRKSDEFRAHASSAAPEPGQEEGGN